MRPGLPPDGASEPGVPAAPALRLSGIEAESIVDGPGLRLVVFTQGCPHGCPGCHNPGTHAFDGGYAGNAAEIVSLLAKNPLLAGVTFSGGEPLVQAAGLLPVAAACKARGKNCWCFTGFRFEELLGMMKRDAALAAFLSCIDVLVDGRYEEARKSLDLRYRGSGNQRVLDLPGSLREGRAIPWEPHLNNAVSQYLSDSDSKR